MADMTSRIFYWLLANLRTIAAAAALFSLFFVMDDGLRWLGLFGVVPLALGFAGCPSCGPRGGDQTQSPWPMP